MEDKEGPMHLDGEERSFMTASTHMADDSSVYSESDNYSQHSEPSSYEEDEDEKDDETRGNESEEEIEYTDQMAEQLTERNVDQFLKKYFDPFYTTFQRKKQGERKMIKYMRKRMGELMQRVLKVRSVVEEFGLCDEHFNLLLDVILNYMRKAKWKRDMFSMLIPRGTIPAHTFMKAISALNSIDQPATEIRLLNWLVTMYKLVEEKEQVEKLYGIIFMYLERYQTRDAVCRLLYLMTQSKHIRKYRTDRLLELLKEDSENRHLMGLLQAYRQYDDTIVIPFNIRVRNDPIFVPPCPELEKRLRNIQRRWNVTIEDHQDNRKDFLLSNGIRTIKRAKTNQPGVVFAPKFPSTLYFDPGNVLQKACDTESIKVPELIVSADGSQVLNHTIALNPNSRLIHGASTVINQALFGSLASFTDPTYRAEQLEKQFDDLLGFARFHKHHLWTVDTFLQNYIKNWNGYEFVDKVFEMISYINPLSYDDLHRNYLIPLYRLFCVSKISWKAKMIQCFAGLLSNWGLVDWKEHLKIKQGSNQDVETITNQLVHLQLDVDYFETIRKLIRFIDRVSVFGLVLEQDDATLQHASLSFFETVSLIYLELDFPEIIIPSPAFVYRHFFSKNAVAISRICGIISEYKKAFEHNEKEEREWGFEATPEQMGIFNGYMTDICNALWLNKAFVKGEGNLGFQLSDDLIRSIMDICSEKGNDLNEIGSLVQSPATCNFTKKFVRSLDAGGGSALCTKAVTPDSFKEIAAEEGIAMTYSEFKREYLDYLSELGFKGYHELLFSCMGSLRKARNSSGRRH